MKLAFEVWLFATLILFTQVFLFFTLSLVRADYIWILTIIGLWTAGFGLVSLFLRSPVIIGATAVSLASIPVASSIWLGLSTGSFPLGHSLFVLIGLILCGWAVTWSEEYIFQKEVGEASSDDDRWPLFLSLLPFGLGVMFGGLALLASFLVDHFRSQSRS